MFGGLGIVLYLFQCLAQRFAATARWQSQSGSTKSRWCARSRVAASYAIAVLLASFRNHSVVPSLIPAVCPMPASTICPGK